MPQAVPVNGSDEELFLLVQTGSQRAFEVLVHRYEKELFCYLSRYIGDSTQAEDVFQNTFLAIFTKREQYEKGRAFKPWLYAVATNQAIDAMRREGRRSMVSLERVIDNASDFSPIFEILESSSLPPLADVQAGELREIVRKSVDGLPEFLRQVVILTYFQGLKYHEAAEVLEIPVGTVKSRLHAALARLAESWEKSPSLREV